MYFEEIAKGALLSTVLTSLLYFTWLRYTMYRRSTILFILIIVIIVSFTIPFLINLKSKQSLGIEKPQVPQFTQPPRPQFTQPQPPQFIQPQAPRPQFTQPQAPTFQQPLAQVPQNRFFRRNY